MYKFYVSVLEKATLGKLFTHYFIQQIINLCCFVSVFSFFPIFLTKIKLLTFSIINVINETEIMSMRPKY